MNMEIPASRKEREKWGTLMCFVSAGMFVPSRFVLGYRRSRASDKNVRPTRSSFASSKGGGGWNFTLSWRREFSVNLLENGSAKGPVILAVFKTVDRYL